MKGKKAREGENTTVHMPFLAKGGYGCVFRPPLRGARGEQLPPNSIGKVFRGGAV